MVMEIIIIALIIIMEPIIEKKYIKKGKNCCINIGGELIDDKCKLENINKEIKLVELGNDGTKEYDKYCDTEHKYKASNYTH